MIITKDSERYQAAEALIAAAHEFWRACARAGQGGAVQWLTGRTGELIIFTRGEYRHVLMQNIDLLPGMRVDHFEGDELEAEDEDA